MTRAYLRLDPGFYERKLDQGYSLPQIAAYVGCLCLADAQSQRGHFRDLVVLKALLGPGARHVPVLLERGDLVMVGKRVYVEGWDEWQEGDWQVKERLARVRSRKTRKATVATVSGDTHLAESVAGHSKAENGSPYHGAPKPAKADRPTDAKLVADLRRFANSKDQQIAKHARERLGAMGLA